jgi:hypothetical protein
MVSVIGNHCGDHVVRNGAKRNLANHGQYRQADSSVNSATQDESRCRGNRERCERLVPEVLAHIAVPRYAIG